MKTIRLLGHIWLSGFAAFFLGVVGLLMCVSQSLEILSTATKPKRKSPAIKKPRWYNEAEEVRGH